ncbi:MAG: hypothetical protein EOO12_00390 [Chitinophagaceae bacterium]|nr:MAG: hypothetical protein EOO12_00390 [Chitinophagaceae bacterium]
MKPRICLLLAAVLSLPALVQARVLTLSNNPQNPGQYSTYTAAEAAATAGDTIYVHGSPVSYNSITITKAITLIGPGHNPQKQAPLKATFENVALQSSNISVIGIICNYFYPSTSSLSNVLLSRNRIEYYIYVQFHNCNNWRIEGNVISYLGNDYAFRSYNYNLWDFFFDNNIFNGYLSDNFYGTSYNMYFNNCVFLKKSGSADYHARTWKNATYTNCIFYGKNPAIANETSGNVFNNCISYAAADNSFPGSGSGNIVNQNPLFASYSGNGFVYTDNYALQAGSPGKSYGLDGNDLGLYGGTYVWNQNGLPKLPYISEFTISNNQVSAGGTLNINFKSSIAQ